MKYPGSNARWGALVLLGLVLAGCGSKGIVRDPAPLKDIDHPAVSPKQVWSEDIGNGSGGVYPELRIAVAEDGVFAGAEDGRVKALDPKTGKVIWSTDTKLRLISGPTLSGDQVLFGTLDAQVVALHRPDGKLLWTAQASSEVMAPPVSNGQVVIARGGDGRVFGLDPQTGKQLWNYDHHEPSLTLSGQSMPLFSGDRVLMGLDTGEVISLDTTDGKLAWSQALSIPTGRSELQRLDDVDADLLPSIGGGVFAVSYGGDIALLDSTSGEPRWKRRVKSYSGMTLSPDGATLFVSDADGYVWALDAATGAEAWKQKALQYRELSAPAYFDGYVVVGDLQGYLHWLDPSTGKIVGRTRLDSAPIVAPPIVAQGRLYVMDTDGDLAAYVDKKPD